MGCLWQTNNSQNVKISSLNSKIRHDDSQLRCGCRLQPLSLENSPQNPTLSNPCIASVYALSRFDVHVLLSFTARRSYASAVLGVVILSACLSVTRVLCDKTKQCTADILIPHERAITLVFWHQQWLVGDAPSVWNLRSKSPTPFEKCRLRQISAYNVSKFNYDQ